MSTARRSSAGSTAAILVLSIPIVLLALVPLGQIDISSESGSEQLGDVIESFTSAAFSTAFCSLALVWSRRRWLLNAWTSLLIAGITSAAAWAASSPDASIGLSELLRSLQVALGVALLVTYRVLRPSGPVIAAGVLVMISALVMPERSWLPPDLLGRIGLVAAELTLFALVVIMAGHVRRRSRVTRRILQPVLVATVALALAVATSWSQAQGLVVGLIPAAIAVSVLQPRLIRARLGRDLLAAFQGQDPHHLREAIRRALGDPGLDIWLPAEIPGQWLDLAGRPGSPARAGALRKRHLALDGEGAPLALFDVDAQTSAEQPALLRAAIDTSRVGMENARLDAQLNADIRELDSSRRRVITVLEDEQRRISRRLNEGADSHLAWAENLLAQPDPDPAMVITARKHVLAGLRDLRSLAQGIHPALLSQAGLGAALRALAEQHSFPVDVRVDETGDDRPPVPVAESAAYLAVSEALAWAVAATADSAEIDVRLGLRSIDVRVVVAGPSGLRLPGAAQDRVLSLGGSLEPWPSGTLPPVGLSISIPCVR